MNDDAEPLATNDTDNLAYVHYYARTRQTHLQPHRFHWISPDSLKASAMDYIRPIFFIYMQYHINATYPTRKSRRVTS